MKQSKKIICLLIALLFCVMCLAGCVDKSKEDDENDAEKGENHVSCEITILVGTKEFSAVLEDNATVREFVKLLPYTATMSDMPHEKYCYLPQILPVNASKRDEIQTGDIMLWGNNCLVLFYESFTTNYSYTRLGKVSDVAGFAQALRKDGASVVFDIKK